MEITAVLDGDYCSTWAKYWRTYFEEWTLFMLLGVIADSNKIEKVRFGIAAEADFFYFIFLKKLLFLNERFIRFIMNNLNVL